MKKLLSFFFIAITAVIITLLSIRNYNLYEENAQLNLIVDEVRELKLTAIPMLFNKEIKLGEKFVADVHIVMIDENNSTNIMYKDSVSDNAFNLNDFKLKELKDTLKKSPNSNTFRYEFQPKSRGKYIWRGVVYKRFAGKIDSLFFEVDYFVE